MKVLHIFRFAPWLFFCSLSIIMGCNYFSVHAACTDKRTSGQSVVWQYAKWNFGHKMKSVGIHFSYFVWVLVVSHFKHLYCKKRIKRQRWKIRLSMSFSWMHKWNWSRAPLILNFGSRYTCVVNFILSQLWYYESSQMYSFSWRLIGLQRQFRRFGEEINLLILPGVEYRIIDLLTCSLYWVRYLCIKLTGWGIA